jgi:hypothetical protein
VFPANIRENAGNAMVALHQRGALWRRGKNAPNARDASSLSVGLIAFIGRTVLATKGRSIAARVASRRLTGDGNGAILERLLSDQSVTPRYYAIEMVE